MPKVYLLTKADYDWNEPLGVFTTIEEARAAIDALRRVRWLGKDAPGTEYPTVDSAAVPNDRFAHYLIREMELGDCEG
jgi:hypothetical protein